MNVFLFQLSIILLKTLSVNPVRNFKYSLLILNDFLYPKIASYENMTCEISKRGQPRAASHNHTRILHPALPLHHMKYVGKKLYTFFSEPYKLYNFMNFMNFITF